MKKRQQNETIAVTTPTHDFKSVFAKCEEQNVICTTHEDCKGDCSWCWSDDNETDKPFFCAPPWDLLTGELELLFLERLDEYIYIYTNYVRTYKSVKFGMM